MRAVQRKVSDGRTGQVCKTHLRLTMKAVSRATSSMLTPIDANTTMAISRLRLLADLAGVWSVLAEELTSAVVTAVT